MHTKLVMTSNFSRTIWSERGINISKLETTDIPNSIRSLKWGNFILPRPQYHPEIVRAFYAALVPKTFEESGTVFVQGRKVVITAKLINEHFCTPNIPGTNFMDCETREEFFSKFVSKLRWDKSNQSLVLLYEELHPEMALWTMFINHNLIPSSNQTALGGEVANILCHIKSGIPIDVGRIIHEQICDANDSDSSLLPFPSLINHFCLLSGVTIRGDLFSPLADIGKALYNSFAEQQDLPTLPLNKRDQVPTKLMMASNFSRTIWSERGIDVSNLETTDIPNTIRRLKWGNFILPLHQYHPEIVRDFYAALVPETFEESGTVFIRGRKVVITPELINQHFCTPNVPETNFLGGRTREEFFSSLDKKILSKLRWDTSNQDGLFMYEELHPEMALWMMFINHNLMPSSNQIFVSPEVAKTLFCIKSGIPIDVGGIIHDQICYANDSGSSLLPFPSLITHFCRLSGVTIPADLCPSLADIGRVSYNSFAHHHGLPALPSRKHDRGVPTTQVQLQGPVPTTPVQPQGPVPTTPVQPQGRAPATPVQPQVGVPATPGQQPGWPLTTPWQGRVPQATSVQPQATMPVQPQPQGQVPTVQVVQLQHGNTDRPKWVNEITGRLNSLSDMIVGQYNALSTQINNLGMRVASLENAIRDEDLDSLRRVRPRPT